MTIFELERFPPSEVVRFKTLQTVFPINWLEKSFFSDLICVIWHRSIDSTTKSHLLFSLSFQTFMTQWKFKDMLPWLLRAGRNEMTIKTETKNSKLLKNNDVDSIWATEHVNKSSHHSSSFYLIAKCVELKVSYFKVFYWKSKEEEKLFLQHVKVEKDEEEETAKVVSRKVNNGMLNDRKISFFVEDDVWHEHKCLLGKTVFAVIKVKIIAHNLNLWVWTVKLSIEIKFKMDAMLQVIMSWTESTFCCL